MPTGPSELFINLLAVGVVRNQTAVAVLMVVVVIVVLVVYPIFVSSYPKLQYDS